MQQDQGTLAPSRSPLNPPTPPAVREAVVADLKAGLKYSEISAKHGVSQGGIGHIAAKAGIRRVIRERRAPTDPEAASGYSADTEILTRAQGWVTFDRLTQMDEVATRTADGYFTWERPQRITWEPYCGDMIEFRSRTAALLAAPGTMVPYMHRRRRSENGTKVDLPPEERTRRAGDLVKYPVSLVATSTWAPTGTPGEITLKPQPVSEEMRRRGGKPPKSFHASISDFAAFMGMYLAEGSLRCDRAKGIYRIDIWQNAGGRGFREYQELLDRLWGRAVPWHASGCWHVQNKGICEFLMTCGKYAWTKTIPPEILGLPPEHLERFWHYYWLGDGTTMNSPEDHRKPLEVISTASPVMAGQLQELLQKLGNWALIQVIDHGKYPGSIAKTTHLTNRLVRRAGTVAFATKIEPVAYDGMIGRAETNVGPVYVRRNYRPVWAGS